MLPDGRSDSAGCQQVCQVDQQASEGEVLHRKTSRSVNRSKRPVTVLKDLIDRREELKSQKRAIERELEFVGRAITVAACELIND